MVVDNQGSLVLFHPESEAEHQWLQTNANAEDWQWSGQALVVDRRLASAVMFGAQEAGLLVLDTW